MHIKYSDDGDLYTLIFLTLSIVLVFKNTKFQRLDLTPF
jgi:hypothetical protein